MSTVQEDTETAVEAVLHVNLFIAFREAKENGLQWHACEASAYEALNKAFPDVDIEAEWKGARGAPPF
jgi:hypothetical protein